MGKKEQDFGRQYQAVIFDLHYTILRPFPSRGVFYRKIFRKYGFDFRPAMIRKAFSETWKEYGDERIARSSLKHHKETNIENWWFDFHYSAFKKLGLRDRKAVRLINREISNRFYSDPRAHKMYDDVMDTLSFLKRRGIKLVLVTNSYKSTKKLIDHFGLTKYFDYVAISCSTGISKPNQKLYLHIVDKFSLHPNQILSVGDSYPTDIVGAQKVGCDGAIIYRKKVAIKKRYGCMYLRGLKQIKKFFD